MLYLLAAHLVLLTRTADSSRGWAEVVEGMSRQHGLNEVPSVAISCASCWLRGTNASPQQE